MPSRRKRAFDFPDWRACTATSSSFRASGCAPAPSVSGSSRRNGCPSTTAPPFDSFSPNMCVFCASTASTRPMCGSPTPSSPPASCGLPMLLRRTRRFSRKAQTFSNRFAHPEYQLRHFAGPRNGPPPRPHQSQAAPSRAYAANSYLMLYPREALSRIFRNDPEAAKSVWTLLQAIPANEFRRAGRCYGGGLLARRNCKPPRHATLRGLTEPPRGRSTPRCPGRGGRGSRCRRR